MLSFAGVRSPLSTPERRRRQLPHPPPPRPPMSPAFKSVDSAYPGSQGHGTAARDTPIRRVASERVKGAGVAPGSVTPTPPPPSPRTPPQRPPPPKQASLQRVRLSLVFGPLLHTVGDLLPVSCCRFSSTHTVHVRLHYTQLTFCNR